LVVGATFAIFLLLSAAAAPPQQDAQGASTVATVPAAPLASPVSLTIDPAQSKVLWTVPSTLDAVHGTFAVSRGSMSFDPASGKASGEIIVDTKSGESGNNNRDARMHREILETAKYPAVVFRPPSKAKSQPVAGAR